jgi:hypothetical protein
VKLSHLEVEERKDDVGGGGGTFRGGIRTRCDLGLRRLGLVALLINIVSSLFCFFILLVDMLILALSDTIFIFFDEEHVCSREKERRCCSHIVSSLRDSIFPAAASASSKFIL